MNLQCAECSYGFKNQNELQALNIKAYTGLRRAWGSIHCGLLLVAADVLSVGSKLEVNSLKAFKIKSLAVQKEWRTGQNGPDPGQTC